MIRLSSVLLLLAACTPLPPETSPAQPELVAPSTVRLAIPEVDGPHLTLIAANELQVESQVAVALDGRVIDATFAGDAALAVLYDRGAVQRVSLDGEPGDVVPVGLGPSAIVADGSRAYVAVSLQDEIVELDLANMAVLRRIPVPGQPRWLHQVDADTLAVTGHRSDTVTLIDLPTGELTDFSLPSLVRDGIQQDLRVTGAVTSTLWNGRGVILVPVLYTDTSLSVSVTTPTVPEELPPAYYVNVPTGPSDFGRVVPVVVTLDAETGQQLDREAAVALTGDQQGAAVVFGGPITSLDARGAFVVALSESESTLASWHLGDRVSSRHGVDVPSVAIATTPAGPHRVYSVGSATWLHSFVSGTMSVMGPGYFGAMDVRTATPIGPQLGLTRKEGSPEVELGRRLFHSSRDTRVGLPGSGVSCNGCHVDGVGDGQTWNVDAGPRQTPSLGGTVSFTEPFTWTGEVPTLEHEIVLTSQGRMASEGGIEHAEAIAAYVDTLPHPPSMATSFTTDLDPDAVARGKQIFEGSAECATCHLGDLLTDKNAHDMFDLTGVDTPTLHGLRATAPYLHDGRAADLSVLVEISEDGGMGRTNHLTAAEKADLVAYLRSL